MEVRKRKWDQADQEFESNPHYELEEDQVHSTDDHNTKDSMNIKHYENHSPDPDLLRSVEEAKKSALLKAQELSAAVAAAAPSHENSESREDTPQGNTFETFSEDIDINDCKNRYLLTKSQTQHEIKEAFSVDITTRGKYFPDRSKATPSEPALHLHVTSTSKQALDNAIAKIYELMDKQVDPIAQDKPAFNARPQPPSRQILTDKVYVDWEADRFFNIRAKIVGPGGAYVKHIQQQSNVRLQLKGKGSGYTETATGRESDEPLHVWLTTTQDEEALEKAKTLLQDLLSKVKTDYEQWKANRGTTTASIGYSASHVHAHTHPHAHERTNRYPNDRSHFSMHPPPTASVPPIHTPPSFATPTAATGMIPPAPPAPAPPPTIVSTPEQYAIYHQYYQQYYQHYYQQYLMMSSMHYSQPSSVHTAYMQPPSFAPSSLPSSVPSYSYPTPATSTTSSNPPSTPTSSSSSSFPTTSTMPSSAPPPTHSSTPSSSQSSSDADTRTSPELSSTSADSTVTTQDSTSTDPYAAYAAYYSQYYQQASNTATTDSSVDTPSSTFPSTMQGEDQSKSSVDSGTVQLNSSHSSSMESLAEPPLEPETKKQRLE